jgi:uncharacterized protein
MTRTASLLRLFQILLLAVGLSAGGAGPVWAEPQIPALSGRVVDQAGVLAAASRQRIEDELAGYESRTSTQIVVVTLGDLQGYPIEDWGLALLRGWQIGQKGKNNGIVLIVAPNDRQTRIETGYGAEGPLPDATASAIIRQAMLPRFRQGDYAAGISDGVSAIEAALAGEFVADQPPHDPFVSAAGITILGNHIPWMTLLILTIWITMALIGGYRRYRGGPRIYTGRRRSSFWDNDWSGGSGGGFGGGFGGGGSGGGFGGGFSGGGGSGGGGGATGRW